jgi:hypothetical protein
MLSVSPLRESWLTYLRALLEHLIENVVGLDVHPLAVIVSKANYLLAISARRKHVNSLYRLR